MEDELPNDVKARIADSSKSPILLSEAWRYLVNSVFLAVEIGVDKQDFSVLISHATVDDETGVSGKEGTIKRDFSFDKVDFDNGRGVIGGGCSNVNRGDGSGVTTKADGWGEEIFVQVLAREKSTIGPSSSGRVT